MNLRASSLAAIAILSLSTACADKADTTPPGTGGAGATGGQGGAAGVGGSTGGTGAGTGGTAAGTGGTGTGGAGAGGTGAGAGGTGAGGAAAGMAGACVLGPGAGAPGTSGTNPPANWSTVKDVLTLAFPGNTVCGSADCHGFGGINPFQLNGNDPAQMYMSLTDTVAADCGQIHVVTPGDPSKSALVKILKGACSCKAPRMPKGCDDDPSNNTCIPDDYVAAIEQWITAGAYMQ